MKETVSNWLSLARLRWLGQVARMSDDRMPKWILFGWLPQTRPAHAVKLLKNFSISDS